MDVRLIQIDQQMLVALGAFQHAVEVLDERLSPLRIGPAEQLLGLLPRQLAAVQGRPDRLAAAPQAEALADPADQTAQGPAWRWISPFDGRSGWPALGGAARITKRCCDLRRKGQRGAGSAPSTGGAAALRWAAQTASRSAAAIFAQRGDGRR